MLLLLNSYKDWFILQLYKKIVRMPVVNNAGTYFKNQVKRVTTPKSIWVNPDLFWFLK